MRWVYLAILLAAPVQADPVDDVVEAARAWFNDMLQLVDTMDFYETCGADQATNARVAYCATGNLLLVAPGLRGAPDAGYAVAHVLGHAIQIRHGIADIALRDIRARPGDERRLRGLVTRQVECLAGRLLKRAGIAWVPLGSLYSAEPFTGSHWGRAPLRIGPRVSIGLTARAAWLQRGYEGNLKDCAVGELTVAPLLTAARGL